MLNGRDRICKYFKGFTKLWKARPGEYTIKDDVKTWDIENIFVHIDE
jgi:hypothetical protein